MTSAVGHSSWSRTSVRGSEMPTPVTGAKSSTTCESEAIPGAPMQVSTPSRLGHPPASTIAPCFHYRFRTALLSFLFLRGPVPLIVLPPSCLLLVPQTSDLRIRSSVIRVTCDLLDFALWASCPPSLTTTPLLPHTPFRYLCAFHIVLRSSGS